MNRRAFCLALGTSLIATRCARSDRPDESARDGLARILRLKPDEATWVDDLKPAEQQQLYEALTASSGAIARPAVDLLMKVIGRRERLFAYVGYPPLPNRLGACDGLLRE